MNFPVGRRRRGRACRCADPRRRSVDGADEIDLVVPWRALVAGQPGGDRRDRARGQGDRPAAATLKAILETGELRDPGLIRRAADEALAGGADFLKTSTGKVAVNATPEAAEILLAAIRDCGRDAGLKPAGGVQHHRRRRASTSTSATG